MGAISQRILFVCFNITLVKFIKRCLAEKKVPLGENNHLSIALDDNQNIYRKTQTWKNPGMPVRWRIHRLTWIYRNCRAITDFARRFIDENNAEALSKTEPIF